MSYVDARGVRTYYEEHGAGAPLLLLHGGLATIEGLGSLVPPLAERFRVVLPERRGHGRTPEIEGPLTYDAMASDTIAFMDALDIGKADLVGYSDGANVALLVAIGAPERVRRLVSISGNFHPPGILESPDEPSADAGDPFSEMRALYARISPDGADHFDVLVEKTHAMWASQTDISRDQLSEIRAPALVMAGDRDMISHEHTLELFDALRDARLAIVPGTTHGLVMEKPALVARLILDFLSDA